MCHSGLRLVAGGATFGLALLSGTVCAQAEPPSDLALSVTWTDTQLNTPLNRVRFIDKRTGFAFGERGKILATTDGGVTWQSRDSKTSQSFYGAHFVDARNGWAVGQAGNVVATTDGGANWQPFPYKGRSTLRGVFFLDNRNGWVVGERGTVLSTVDAGANWQPARTGVPRGAIYYDVYFTKPETGWIVGERGIVLATADGGQNWETRDSQTKAALYAVAFGRDGSADTGWAVGASGTIQKTTDGGKTWETQTSSVAGVLRGLHVANANEVTVVGDDGVILTTADGGATWKTETAVTERSLRDIAVVDGTAWIVGDRGIALSRHAAQAEWQILRPALNSDLYDVYFTKSGTGWAVGDLGLVLVTRDGGATWQRRDLGTKSDLRALTFTPQGAGFIVGNGGVILRTRDGGAHWTQQSLQSAIEPGGIAFTPDGRNGWMIGSSGAIFATQDGGDTWTKQNSGTDQTFQNLQFVDARNGWAVGDGGTIVTTRDGGATWSAQDAKEKGTLNHLFFFDTQYGWVVGDGGTILRTVDGGRTWATWADWRAEQGLKAPPAPTSKDLLHVFFANRNSGWVTGRDGVILTTRNGGKDWSAEKSLTDKNLFGMHFADAYTGVAVGTEGTILRADKPTLAPWADALMVTPVRSGTSTNLNVSFAVHQDDRSPLRSVQLIASPANAPEVTSKPKQAKLNEGDSRWHAALTPDDYNIHSGDKIEYRVQLEDAHPAPLTEIVLDSRVYDPWFAKFLDEYWSYIVGFFAAFGLLFLYVAIIGLILLFRPATIAYWGSAPILDDLPKPSGTAAFVWDLARKALGGLIFPWMCRLPRVRRAWMRQFAAGKSTLDDLGKARASFVSSPEVLDAWVTRVTPKVEAALCQLDLYAQRRIYVELPVRVGERGKVIDRPNAETLRQLFAKERAVVAIIGSGGAGKSTLACALARWAMCPDPADRIAPHKMIPVFIMQDTTNLVDAVTQNLRRMLGDENLPDDLVRGLLAKQRVLVIVDALSERGPDTQAHIEQVFGQNVPVNAIVITSRTEPKLINVDRTVLHPVRLDAARVVPFIIGYLGRMEEVGQLQDGRLQLRLGDQILALAESGGQKTPITPLLVTLFVNSAVQRAVDAHSFDDMPQAVPEVFVDYLRRVFAAPAQDDDKISDDIFIQAAQTLATTSLGNNMVPQDFTMDDAVAALAAGMPASKPRALIDRLDRSGVIERRTPGGYVALRFSLDPAAEYLAAIRQLFKMKRAGPEDWTKYLVSLMQVNGYPRSLEGYLMALATCYRAYKRDFSLPEMQFPWEKVAEQPASAASPAITEAAA